MNVSISNYTGRNTPAHRVEINNLTLWFSYRTPVAFSYMGEFCIRENVWSTTTGRHLNEIDDDHSIRISGEEFNKRLNQITINIVHRPINPAD